MSVEITLLQCLVDTSIDHTLIKTQQPVSDGRYTCPVKKAELIPKKSCIFPAIKYIVWFFWTAESCVLLIG